MGEARRDDAGDLGIQMQIVASTCVDLDCGALQRVGNSATVRKREHGIVITMEHLSRYDHASEVLCAIHAEDLRAQPDVRARWILPPLNPSPRP